jgi:hypothetical protein
MVDTALLVALIGIAGTLSASILTVLSEPWRKKKVRDAKRESIRNALYSELARIAINVYFGIKEIETMEQNLKRVGALRRDSEEAERPLNENQDSSEATEVLDSKLLSTTKIAAENLVGGFFTAVHSDAKLTMLFYELPEADLAGILYSQLNQYIGEASVFEDPKDQWRAFVSLVETQRDAFVQAYENGYLDITMLRRYCYLPSQLQSLDDLLKKPQASLLKEYLEKS